MGVRYFFFRAGYELQLRSGLWKRRFPASPTHESYISLSDWQRQRPVFFFPQQGKVGVGEYPVEDLRQLIARYRKGFWLFFSGREYELGNPPDWLLNPDSGYRYEAKRHWTEIRDFSAEAGDIKFIWELSRFSWLGEFIRWDHHSGEDLGEEVFSLLDHWMDANPLNLGPQYRCSQEIALRLMNWTLALYYYAEHPALTEARFARLMHYFRWQLDHIEKNRKFSQIAVRNNHAMTEALSLYLGGLLFPFLPRAAIWRKLGKEWFEREILFQIAEDGSYIQHSHNYHRVVVQLLCWYLVLRAPNETERELPENVRQCMQRTLAFLLAFQEEESGCLPQYGANDGALFFKLSACAYADFRPQLNALHLLLEGSSPYPRGPWDEEAEWLGLSRGVFNRSVKEAGAPVRAFPEGGLYLLGEEDSKTIVRCASFRHRPAQADNLHLDVWFRGVNVLRDAGSYRYHTDARWVRYFNGTASHNSLMLGDEDQMLKGPRFIWYHWSRALFAGWREEREAWIFEGEIEAFRQLVKGIRHHRRVTKYKGRPEWLVEDRISHGGGLHLPLRQYWHPHPASNFSLQITATDLAGNPLEPRPVEGWYAPTYAVKEPSPAFYFESEDRGIIARLLIV